MAGGPMREYLFKVALEGTGRVWRVIAMQGHQTLDHLHHMIFVAFDREEEHLYSFYFPKIPSRRAVAVREYTSPQSFEDSGPFDDGRQFNAADAMFDDLQLKVGQRFEYLFDFGDSWCHQIKVQSIGPLTPGKRLPAIVERSGESPPQYPDDE